MDMNYIQLIQMLIIFLAVFFTFAVFIPMLEKKQKLKYTLIRPDIEPAYVDFDILLDRQDAYAYDKYQIWRYVIKQKNNSISS